MFPGLLSQDRTLTPGNTTEYEICSTDNVAFCVRAREDFLQSYCDYSGHGSCLLTNKRLSLQWHPPVSNLYSFISIELSDILPHTLGLDKYLFGGASFSAQVEHSNIVGDRWILKMRVQVDDSHAADLERVFTHVSHLAVRERRRALLSHTEPALLPPLPSEVDSGGAGSSLEQRWEEFEEALVAVVGEGSRDSPTTYEDFDAASNSPTSDEVLEMEHLAEADGIAVLDPKAPDNIIIYTRDPLIPHFDRDA